MSDFQLDDPRTSRAAGLEGSSAPTDPTDADATRSFEYELSATPTDEAGDDLADSEPTVISRQLPLEPLPSWSSLRPRELGHLLEGRSLDHFQLDGFIGGGGMGAVFRARDTVLGRTVAVKVLAGGAAGSEETRQRFHNEAQSAARLDHPNIARVHYVGEADGFKYIVFEYLQGRNLRDLVADVGPLSVPDALNFTLQIAEALAHAWQRDIVHRDIKPSNVLATPEGQVKLVDMGLARLRDVTTPTEELTASGVTLGTFDYISPEQARDPRNADIRSDIYSLGCTLYFMLCGRPPFQGGTALQKLLMHQAEEPPSPREFRPDLPAGMEALLARMLAKSPDERFQNPAELIAAVTTLAEELGIAVKPTTTVQLTIAGQGSGWITTALPWLAPAVLLLASVLIIEYLDGDAAGGGPATPPSWSQHVGSVGQADLSGRDRAPVTASPTRGAATPASRDGERAAADVTAAGRGSSAVENGVRTDAAREREPAPRQDVALNEDVAQSPPPAVERPFSFAPDWSALRAQADEWLRPFRVADWEPPNEESSGSGLSVARNSPDTAVWNVTQSTAHKSLAEAVAAARDRDVLELTQDGVTILESTPLPIRVSGKEISLRGRQGIWPILHVRTGSELRGAGGVSKVFVVENGGALLLQGLSVELEHPATTTPSGWRLFELAAGGAVQIRDCWLTIRGNAAAEFERRSHDDFFVAAGKSAGLVGGMRASAAEDPVEIDLRNVVIRGGDTLVAVDGDAHVWLHADNGLFVLRGYLYDAIRRDFMSQGASKIELSHLTVETGAGGLRIRDVGRTNRLQVNVQNSILVGGRGRAVVEHALADFPATRDLPIEWKGSGNVYDSWEFLFRQQVSNAEGTTFDFSKWQEYWRDRDAQASTGPARWRHPRRASEPPFNRTPADYLVEEATGGSNLASGEPPPGLIVDFLPYPAPPRGPDG